MIEVSNLSKSYGPIEAVSKVSFSVKRGEIVGFLGPNGAGKTTCLKIMTCFIAPSAGSVKIAGMDVQEKPREVRQKFGYLPENAPIYGDMIVYDYLAYVGALRGLSGKKLTTQLAAVAERVGIGRVLGQVAGTLSKGYRQRVCLAQALIHDPEILILDEPTVGLDPNQVVEIRSLIKQLGSERTVILSSHILPEVLVTCDRLIIIHRGGIVADGTPAQLQEQMATNPPVIVRLASGANGFEEKVVRAFESAGFAGQVRQKHVGLAGEVEFELVSRDGADIRSRAVEVVGANGWKLLEVRRDLMDIEGLFRRLTQE
jgi:ABC-2 type transport system ATP-binding protein